MKKKPYNGEPIVERIEPQVTINRTVKIQSLLDAHVIYDGQVTGQHYEWGGAGTIVTVDEQDVPELLSKRRGKKPCCGNSEQPPIFQVA